MSTIAAPNRRERNRLAKHEAIAAAALELFADQGYERTTIEEIAARADVSLRTFFRYFPTKDRTIFNELRPSATEVTLQLLSRPTADDLWTRLGAAYCATARRHTPATVRTIRTRYRLIRNTPALLARHAEHTRAEQDEVVRVLREQEGAERGPEIALLVSVAYATIWHALDRWAQEDGDDTADALADRLERTFRMLPAVLLPGGDAKNES
jgi:AcrR family transcriptional regulator